ncbi:hypothetical protein ZPR_1316 [Zunongwangia profunda SM-A87]|uniref:Uncharacterized protein n=1 Tax=Zunongwangia profunda (strain DSM 18752 / CCTCC AB 206139 / SM-A87) TaxID=655815 RepID=D5BJI6_ZUNPS|nr:hypothetical protein ZPR_1316 [Zunongwangia profunda SM-A87]|tara:strand:- start:3947 stop:4048 length:102 start_codon:yes stop_codon:yes gene_type:complete
MILISFSENNLDKNIPSEGNINLPPCAESVRVD